MASAHALPAHIGLQSYSNFVIAILLLTILMIVDDFILLLLLLQTHCKDAVQVC